MGECEGVYNESSLYTRDSLELLVRALNVLMLDGPGCHDRTRTRVNPALQQKCPSLLAFLQLRPYLTRSLELISCNLSNYDLPYLHIFASFVRDILDTYSSHRFEEQRASERTRAR